MYFILFLIPNTKTNKKPRKTKSPKEANIPSSIGIKGLKSPILPRKIRNKESIITQRAKSRKSFDVLKLHSSFIKPINLVLKAKIRKMKENASTKNEIGKYLVPTGRTNAGRSINTAVVTAINVRLFNPNFIS
ncbi:MAG: hypothetical protein ACI37R_04715 [Candidatus Avigastranaerophilus sp.]